MPMFWIFLPAFLIVAASTSQDTGRGGDIDGYDVRRSSAATAALLGAGRDAWERAQEVTWGPEIYATSFAPFGVRRAFSFASMRSIRRHGTP